MRAPLVVLIVAYAISILGLVIIPGVDENGETVRVSFFHAFYFVSYMATTIGFGELPGGFTDAQRMWTLFSIYLTVIAWLYGIGKILSLMQDSAFRNAVKENQFTRSVSQIMEPFYIICGYGDTGTQLVKALSQRDIRAVVIDYNQARINELETESQRIDVPGICSDARLTQTLKEAGLLNRSCNGIIAITDNDSSNLKIAITAKLLRPGLKVVCRTETHDAAANMSSFGTDHIFNPFDTFAAQFALALHSPSLYLLSEWVTGVPDAPLSQPVYPPEGRWILCGYGRFGKELYKHMIEQHIEATIVEAEPAKTGCTGFCIEGRGTEANTLIKAGIKDAVGIVAGTDDDANNLSIVMTAAEVSPDIFIVARQNRHDNDEIFEAALLDIVMHRSDIIAHDIFAHLTNPLIGVFLKQITLKDNDWANRLLSRICAIVDDVVPDIWSVTIDTKNAPAVIDWIDQGGEILLGDIMISNVDHTKNLPIVALIKQTKKGELILEPEDTTILKNGDQLLFCGPSGMENHMEWILKNHNSLNYVKTGVIIPAGILWRNLKKLRVNQETFTGE
jgi:Trk K+ transport system NAD-binding subunit